EPGDTNILVTNLVGIVIVPDRAKVITTGGMPMFGVEAHGIELLKGPDFTAVLAPYLYHPLTVGGVKDMQDAIILYCRKRGHPLVDVILLPQVIDNGVIQFWFLEAKVGNVTIENEGEKWFSGRYIRRQIRLSRDQPVDTQKLLEDLDWLNRNP